MVLETDAHGNELLDVARGDAARVASAAAPLTGALVIVPGHAARVQPPRGVVRARLSGGPSPWVRQDVAPGVLWRIAEQVAGFVDGEERFVAPHLATHLHPVVEAVPDLLG